MRSRSRLARVPRLCLSHARCVADRDRLGIVLWTVLRGFAWSREIADAVPQAHRDDAGSRRDHRKAQGRRSAGHEEAYKRATSTTLAIAIAALPRSPREPPQITVLSGS
ncbi:hypothetical protein GCM10009555_107510 [Acrocarpospora macrocephala]